MLSQRRVAVTLNDTQRETFTMHCSIHVKVDVLFSLRLVGLGETVGDRTVLPWLRSPDVAVHLVGSFACGIVERYSTRADVPIIKL